MIKETNDDRLNSKHKIIRHFIEPACGTIKKDEYEYEKKIHNTKKSVFFPCFRGYSQYIRYITDNFVFSGIKYI